MIIRCHVWNGTLIATLLLLSATTATAQGRGGFSFNVGGQKIQIGAPSRSNSSRSPSRVQLPAVIPGGNAGNPSGLQRVLQSAASGVASESLRQLAPGIQQTMQRTGLQSTNPPFRPESGRSRLRLNLAGFQIEHAAALAAAIGVGGITCETKNPFCGSRPVCPPRPCPVPPTIPATHSPERNFELARQAFRQREYDRALYYIDRAIEQLPQEPDLFQFRSLILFAVGEYPLSAEAAYTALAAGPGWNWNTLYQFYGDADLYTQHLRKLEAASKENPESAAHHFLLAYHSLMLGQVETGRKKLERVLELQPGEPLTQSLLDILPPGNENAAR